MKRMQSTQYTIRAIPARIDAALRAKARVQHQSLNEAAIEAMERGVGLHEEELRYHDLDKLIGTWVEDPEFDAALAEFDCIDRDMWE